MQFMINTDTDSISSLRAVAAILLADAATREAQPAPGFRTDAPPPPPPPPPSDPEETRVLTPAEIAAAVGTAPPPPAAIVETASHGYVAAPGVPLVPPPPPPPATLPGTPPTLPGPLAELDSDGKPWDAALHAGTKTKTADGRWKKKRNTGATTTTTEAPPAGSAPPPPPPAAGTTAPPPPPATTAPTAPEGPTFRSVMAKAKAAVESGKLSHDKVGELVRKAGAPDLTTLNSMAHLIPQVDALLDAELFGK